MESHSWGRPEERLAGTRGAVVVVSTLLGCTAALGGVGLLSLAWGHWQLAVLALLIIVVQLPLSRWVLHRSSTWRPAQRVIAYFSLTMAWVGSIIGGFAVLDISVVEVVAL